MGGDFLKDIEETTFNDSFNHFYEENYNKKQGDILFLGCCWTFCIKL